MSRMEQVNDRPCPVLTSLSQEALHTTEAELLQTDHPINIKSVSGKRKGMSVMIGDYIYVASGSQPSDDWIRMPRREKASFTAGSTATIVVPTASLSSPISPTGLVIQQRAVGFDLDSNGYVRNTTGRLLDRVTGTITLDLDKQADGLGTSSFYLWSERSHDNGVVWAANQFSLRHLEISSSDEGTYTFTSFFYNWEPDALMRWQLAVKGGSAMRLKSVQELIGSEVVRGYSLLWAIQED